LYLAENPLCRDCEERGLVVAATEVHHVAKVADRFTLSPNGRAASNGDVSISFTPRQAACVDVLVEAHQQGFEELHYSDVLAGAECWAETLHDVFRHCKDWRLFILRGSRPGFVKLFLSNSVRKSTREFCSPPAVESACHAHHISLSQST
jgi:hypothetical protein